MLNANALPLVLYFAAGVLYAAHFATRQVTLGRSATAVLALGGLAHTFVIGMQTMEAGHVPIAGTTQAISTFVWLLALAYLYMEMSTEERALGVFIVPLLIALQAIRALNPVVEKRVPILESPWFGVHVASLLFAYASFALACVIGITYVLLFKEIKAKHLGFFYKRLPSLDSLDLMNARTTTIGWIFLTVGVLVGTIWAAEAKGGPVFDPRVQAMSLADPKILGAAVCWAIYTFALYTRRIGWGGKRAAYLSAVGFAIVLFNFVPIGYFLTRSHNFGGEEADMHLFLLGVSHRTTPVELREKLDFATRGLDQALTALATRPNTNEAVVLSTCNRAEIYVACEEVGSARTDLLGFLAEYHGLAADALVPHLYERVDSLAAQHLFRVAGGLDSLVVGEPQILGQVKDAYSAATDGGTSGPVLNKVFPWSFTVGKRVRTETALSEGAVSVSFAATALAKKIFGDLTGRTVLVIGAGEMGKLTAQHLKGQGVERVLITSRTLAHATALAESIGGQAVPWADMLSTLTQADIVITATGATLPILTRQQVEAALRGRRNRPLFLIDIALPRDVDPAVGDLGAVFLYNIDDLQAVVQENLTRRAAEVARAEAIVVEEVKKFETWLSARGAIPTVVALRQRFEAIRRNELDRLQPKLAGLPPEARSRVDEVTRLLVEKLLITPTEQLKSTPDPERVRTYADALTRLFALDAEEPARGEPGRVPAARRAGDAGKSGTP